MGFLILVVILVVIVSAVANGSSQSAQKRTATRPSSRRELSTGSPRASASTSSLLQAPSEAVAVRESQSCWVPAGQTVQVAGLNIPGGMIYVGKSMRSLRGFAMDPALINPSLSVSKDLPDTVGRNLHYWPSYSEVHSTSRAAYLNWLAGGRRDPKVAIGYVFLFFYGIERRVLLDAMYSDEAIAEVPALLTEVQELLQVYGSNGSFGRYANAFMDLMVAAASDQDISQLVPPREKTGWEIPFSVKLALGHFVTQGKPIPAEWAFS